MIIKNNKKSTSIVTIVSAACTVSAVLKCSRYNSNSAKKKRDDKSDKLQMELDRR